MEKLQEKGRLPASKKTPKGLLKARQMKEAGLEPQWLSDNECKVPSETKPGITYLVDVWRVICACPAAAQKGE